MSRSVALSVIRARVRFLADLGPDATTGRYPTATVNREINAAWQRLRHLASKNGHQLYLKSTTPTTMTVGPLAGYSFGTIPLPADCVAVYGLDVTINSTDIRTIYPGDFGDRNYFHDAWGGLVGPPEAFHIYNFGVESAASIAAGVCAIFPAPDRAYTYSLWYIPSWVDRANDTDVFDCVEGWDDWVIQDCVIKFAQGDNDRANTYRIAVDEREKTEKMVLARATKIQRVGPSGRQDVRAIKASLREVDRYRRP